MSRLESRLVICVLLGLVLSACATYDDIPFERMNEAELADYNRNRPVAQMIVCSEIQRTLSRIKRRRCTTVERMYGSEAQAAQLDVLNSIPGYVSGN